MTRPYSPESLASIGDDYIVCLLEALDNPVIDNPTSRRGREHDITRESYCHTCGSWEPRWAGCIVCTDCGHVFVTAVNVKTWADYMERAGYTALPPTLCPFCAGELQ